MIAELEELKADEALAAPSCKRQAMSRTLMTRERTPPPIPDSMIPNCSWIYDRHAKLFAAITVGTRFAIRD